METNKRQSVSRQRERKMKYLSDKTPQVKGNHMFFVLSKKERTVSSFLGSLGFLETAWSTYLHCIAHYTLLRGGDFARAKSDLSGRIVLPTRPWPQPLASLRSVVVIVLSVVCDSSTCMNRKLHSRKTQVPLSPFPMLGLNHLIADTFTLFVPYYLLCFQATFASFIFLLILILRQQFIYWWSAPIEAFWKR